MHYAMIVGAQKAASTYLHNALSDASEICGWPGKEPHYFSSKHFNGEPYAHLFDTDDAVKVCLDSSASYLHTASAAEKIAEAGLDPWVIVVIRQPLKRAMSGFLHNAKNGRDTRRAEAALSLDATQYDDVFQEETERIETALRRGQIIMRPTYRHHFGDQTYDDPYWTFRYVSNSFYTAQAQPFLTRFSRVSFVDFEPLVRDPLGAVNPLRAMFGLAARDGLSDSLGQNATAISTKRVVRKYLRNWREHAPQDRPSMAKAARAALRILQNSYSAKPPLTAFQAQPWIRAAERDFEQAQASAINSDQRKPD